MKRQLVTGLFVLTLVASGPACFLRRQPLDWHITLEVDRSIPNREAAVGTAVKVLESRLDALGLSNFEVKKVGAPSDGRITINLPAVTDRERIKKLLSSQGQLELSHVISPPSPAPIQAYATREEAVQSFGGYFERRGVLPWTERRSAGGSPQRWVVVERPPIIDGSELRTATATAGAGGATDYSIAFTLRPEGAEKFAAWTTSHLNEYLAVVYNDEIKSIAFIKSTIIDRGEITGQFTKEAAEDIALILRSGVLPKVSIVEEGPNK
jgi:preprotein translocase subunit SecD